MKGYKLETLKIITFSLIPTWIVGAERLAHCSFDYSNGP